MRIVVSCGRVAEDAGLLRGGEFRFGNDAAAQGLLDVEPEMLHGFRGDPRVRFGGIQHQLQQLEVPHVVLLMQPEGFEQMMGILFLFRIELLDPLFRGGDDLFGISLTEFDPRAVADAIDGRFQIFEQSRNRLAIDGDWLLKRPTDGSHAVDATMSVVAVGIADVVLHVANDDVVPVAEIQRAIRCENGIRGAKVLVAAHQQAARLVHAPWCRRRW